MTDTYAARVREAPRHVTNAEVRRFVEQTTLAIGPGLYANVAHGLQDFLAARGADVGRPSLGFERATGSDPGWLCEVANAIEAGNGEAFDLPRLLRNAAHALRGRPSPDGPELIAEMFTPPQNEADVRERLAGYRELVTTGVRGLEDDQAADTVNRATDSLVAWLIRGGHPSEPSPHPDDCKCACYRRGFEDA